MLLSDRLKIRSLGLIALYPQNVCRTKWVFAPKFPDSSFLARGVLIKTLLAVILIINYMEPCISIRLGWMMQQEVGSYKHALGAVGLPVVHFRNQQFEQCGIARGPAIVRCHYPFDTHTGCYKSNCWDSDSADQNASPPSETEG